MPPAVRVLLILAKYAAFGVIPLVIPSIVEDLPLPIERIPQQRGTDYGYVKRSRGSPATCSTWSRGPRPARRRRTGAPRSASACRSRR